VGCVAINGADNASLRWSRVVGGQQAIGGDADFLFGADGSDRLSAWKTAGGELAWSNERLLFRGLSAPLSVGKAVVFGDLEGQLHFLDRAEGKTLLRLPTDGSPIVAQPVLAAGTMLAVTRNGGLFAFRTE
jgi:outer membrane protein assembly factor BamB